MRSSNAVIKTIAVLILAVLCSSAFAEYEILDHVAYDSKNPKGNAWFRMPSDDSIDKDACHAVIENMNILEKYGIDMKEDFPISSKVSLLSKPSWRRVTQDEHEEMCDFIDKKNKLNECVFNKSPLYIYDYIFTSGDIYVSIYRYDVEYLNGYKTKRSYYFIEKKGDKLVKSKYFSFGYDGYYDENDIEIILYKNNLYIFRYESILGQPYVVSHLSGLGERSSEDSSKKFGVESICFIKSK